MINASNNKLPQYCPFNGTLYLLTSVGIGEDGGGGGGDGRATWHHSYLPPPQDRSPLVTDTELHLGLCVYLPYLYP